VAVEIDLLLEVLDAVEVVEESQLGLLLTGLRRLPQAFDQRLWVDLLLNVDGDDRNSEILAVLLVFSLPD